VEDDIAESTAPTAKSDDVLGLALEELCIDEGAGDEIRFDEVAFEDSCEEGGGDDGRTAVPRTL